MSRPPPSSTLFPYTTLFRSCLQSARHGLRDAPPVARRLEGFERDAASSRGRSGNAHAHRPVRSEEHTSELQSLRHLVCRLLLEKKKDKQATAERTTTTWGLL